jgi:hypothetical protein
VRDARFENSRIPPAREATCLVYDLSCVRGFCIVTCGYFRNCIRTSSLGRSHFVGSLILALSAAGAIYLILELGQPFAGPMQISSTPLRNALTSLEAVQ